MLCLRLAGRPGACAFSHHVTAACALASICELEESGRWLGGEPEWLISRTPPVRPEFRDWRTGTLISVPDPAGKRRDCEAGRWLGEENDSSLVRLGLGRSSEIGGLARLYLSRILLANAATGI